MMGEKLLTMAMAMVVSIFVARHLGPGDYGILSYAISLVSLFAIATHMGLHGLAIRELVKFPDQNEELLGTIFVIKCAGAVIAILIFLVLIYTTSGVNDVEFWVLLAVSGAILLKPFEIFDFWFQAKVKAKYSSIVRVTVTVAVSMLKIGLVLLSTQVLAFAFAYLLQAILIAVLLIFFFKRESLISFSKWRFSFSRGKKLLGQGWMVMLGAIFAMVYFKIDQVMLRWFINTEEVGIYSVSAQLSEAWYFIPSVIAASLFPKFIELRKKNNEQFIRRLQQLFDMLFIIALSVGILVSIFSGPIIYFLYGVEFEDSAIILSIHIWAGLFVFMRSALDKWIIVENAFVFSMVSQGAGAFANIALNIILIPQFKGAGAAMATIISYSFATYFSLLFYKNTRPLFLIMSKSLISPLRYGYSFILNFTKKYD